MQDVERPQGSVLRGVFFGAVLVALGFAGCGTRNQGFSDAGSEFPGLGNGNASDASGDDATVSPSFGGGPGGISLLLDGDVADRAPPPSPSCKLPGLWCYQTTAPCVTSLSGTVFDPAGQVPLSGIVVYAVADPSMPLDPITTGTKSCSACTTKVDNYMALAVTDTKGQFKMTGVPATTAVPIVVQAGKWRRKVTLSSVTKCIDNPVKDGTLRLPRNRMEGDMPEMALLTGGCDDMACFLLNVGIDAAEFGAPHSGGRVDVYQGNSMPLGIGGPGPSLSNGTAGNCTNTSCPLWASKQSFEYYDMAILSCQCSEMTSVSETTAGYTNLHDWLNEGGKVFASHYHYTWFKNNPDPRWAATATWLGSSIAGGSGTYDIDTSFPKGSTFGQWMGNVGALASAGPPPTITLASVASSVGAVNTATTQRWIYDPNSSLLPEGGTVANETKYLSFLTPIGGTTQPAGDGGAAESVVYCGKAVFTDLHTSSGLFAQAMTVPAGCTAGPLTAQQKALEYLFFDLAACVAPENAPPPMPPPNPPPPPPPPM